MFAALFGALAIGGIGYLLALLVALALVYWLVPLDGFWKKLIQAIAIVIVIVVICRLLGLF